MAASPPKTTTNQKLRTSPNFVQARTFDGRAYIAKETEPYIQYWLTERDRVLFFLFSGRYGLGIPDAMEAYYRLTGKEDTWHENQRLLKAILDMRDNKVLVDAGADTSRYDAQIVDDYLNQRPFPKALVQHILKTAPIDSNSRVLDLAGGPGDLALQLAQVAGDVTLMELSLGFIQSAGKRAKQLGVKLRTLHDSCNKLVHHDQDYDIVTVSQALHWLDDVQVCRGICRILVAGGSFFVIHSAMELADQHPLAYVLGYDSILGKKQRLPFAAEVQPLFKRLTLLFEALDAPEVQRMDAAQRWQPGGMAIANIVPAGVALFRQRRPFDAGYARGFLTPSHIQATGQTEEQFWKDLDLRCLATRAEQMLGYHHWAVMHFRRGGPAFEPVSLNDITVEEMDF